MTETEEAEELKKKRVLHLTEECADAMKRVVAAMEELNVEMDLPAGDILQLVQDQLGACFEHGALYSVWADLFPGPSLERDGADPMRRLLGRLFKEAPKLTDGRGGLVPDQAPALECVVLIKGLPMEMHGVLSVTPEGTLRMLGAAKDPQTAAPCLVEQFFDYEDIAMVAVKRPMPTVRGASSRIELATH